MSYRRGSDPAGRSEAVSPAVRRRVSRGCLGTQGPHGRRPSWRHRCRASRPISMRRARVRSRWSRQETAPWSGARGRWAQASPRGFRQRPRCPPSDDLQLGEVISHALGPFALVFDHLAGFARRGGADLDNLLGQRSLAGLSIEPEIVQPDLFDLFVLRLHDAAQRRISGLVDATGHRDDSRQRCLHHVIAIVRLPVDLRLAAGDVELFCEAQQRQPKELGEWRRHGARRSVRAFRAANDQVIALPLDRRGDRSRGAERVRVLQPRVGDQDAAMAAHRQRTTDRLHRPRRAHRDDGHLAFVLLDELEAGFDRVLVTRIQDDVDALAHQALGLWVELSGNVRIGDLLHADEDIHGWLLPLWGKSRRSNVCSIMENPCRAASISRSSPSLPSTASNTWALTGRSIPTRVAFTAASTVLLAPTPSSPTATRASAFRRGSA